MVDANIKQVKDFFTTGNPERDSMKAFNDEWKQLADDDKVEIRQLVGEAIGA